MTQQLEIFRAAKDSTSVLHLEEYLQEADDWLTSTEILQAWDMPVTEAKRRWLRMLAEASDSVISGQRGYRHVEYARPEEIHHFIAWMESQGVKMMKRAHRIRKRAHVFIG